MHIIIESESKTKAKKLISDSFLSLKNKQINYISDGNKTFQKYLYIEDLANIDEKLCGNRETNKTDIAMLFTGQGAQSPGMMQSIYENNSTFKTHLDECFLKYEAIFERSLKDIMFSESEEIHNTIWTQPALFAVEYAMAKTFMTLGLKPKYVLGHSVGEYPAAVIAGMMSLETGMELIGKRGQYMQSISTNGSMAALMCNLETTNNLIQDSKLKIDIAGINSLKQTVISGDTDKIKKIVIIAKESKIRATELTVSHAFHSYHMDPILSDFTNEAQKHQFSIPKNCHVISNVTGDIIKNKIEPIYWSQHIRQPVNFVGGINTVIDLGITNFVEVGPKPILSGMGARSSDKKCNWYCANSEIEKFLSTIGELYNKGFIEKF